MPGSEAFLRLRWLVVIGLLFAMPLRADYKQDYARGKNAAADQNWAEVETLMQQALAGSRTPLARTRLYGQRFEPYVPQYYLGLAAYRQGNCAVAMRWFGDTAAAPIIAGNNEFKGIADQAMQSCKSAVATKPPPEQPVVTTPAKPVVSTPVKLPVQTPPTTTQTKPTPPVIASPVESKPGLPAALQSLLDDYLAGRFNKAAVADANTLNGVARFHALLLRSSARHALFEMQPVEAAAQKSAAEADVRLAKSIAPGKAPDAAFYSPRYRKFFNDTR